MFNTDQNIRKLRSALLLGAASATAVGMTPAAIAQQAPATGNVETVVVTGSRIPQAGIYAASPVTAVGQQELKFEGTTDVYTLINNLPEAFADQNSTVTNGGSGTANVDLRGLGSKRTLVLINGSRLMPGDIADPSPDVDTIPVALVDHVEVLTGGASAVYGSDALAGVVNFIMRKDFEGIEVDGQYTVNEADNTNSYDRMLQQTASLVQAPENIWDGSTAEATLIMGTNTANDKGNVTAYLGYRDTQSVLSGARDYSACALISSSITAFGQPKNGGFSCVGSSNFNRWISIDNNAGGVPYDFFENGTGKAGSGNFTPYAGGPAEHFNFGPLQYLQRPDTRYQGGYFAHYQENKQLDVYSSFMFTDDRTVEQLAPSGLFLGSGILSHSLDLVNCGNPLMTPQENQTLCGELAGDRLVTVGGHTYWNGAGNIFNGAGNPAGGSSLLEIGRRNIEGADRQTDLDHASYRMQIGARGDFGDGWSYDVYAQYGTTLLSIENKGNVSKSRVANALQVDPATGQCFVAEPNAQGAVTDPNCVPLDIFDGIGSISPASEKYINSDSFQSGFTIEQIVSGSVTGDLGQWGIQSPWAKNPVSVSLGSEWRAEYLELSVSQDFSSNDIGGSGGATLPVPESGFNVTEGFTEVKIPVIQGLPWAEDITINAGYRYSSYSIAGSTQAYKDGVEWQPIDDVRFRASFERAVRAPNVLELFAPQNNVLFAGNDPCASQTAGQCANVKNAGTGLLSCPAAQCNQEVAGNINLKPETSATKTLGAVFTPTFLDGFTLTVDYFDISVSKFIFNVGANTILAACYGNLATPTTEAQFCPAVHRNILGQIYGGGFVFNPTVNLGYLKTDGIDFEANYTANMDDWSLPGAGSLNFNFVGTFLELADNRTRCPSAFDWHLRLRGPVRHRLPGAEPRLAAQAARNVDVALGFRPVAAMASPQRRQLRCKHDQFAARH